MDFPTSGSLPPRIGADDQQLQQALFIDLQDLLARSQGLKDIQTKINGRIKSIDQLKKQGTRFSNPL